MALMDTQQSIFENQSPEPSLKIERMQESDLEEVLKIERESFSMPWSRRMFETELRETAISYPLVARWQDTENPSIPSPSRICGYTVFWHVVDEIHIGNIAIEKEFRRRKIASALIANIIELAKQWLVKRITLEVRVSNESAIRLYHRFGFREIAIRRKYYTNPNEDALVMIKDDVQPIL